MNASKTQKHLKEISYPPDKSFKNNNNNITPAKANAPITNFFRMPKINTSNLSKLKMKLEQLQDEISKVSFSQFI